MSAFSTRLKQLRNEAKVSQQQLSVDIGISKSSINMYERGEREPGLEMVKALADYFDVNTDYILGKSDDKRSIKNGRKYAKKILDMLEEYRVSHDLTRDQMEEYLDWTGMYEKIESGRVLMSEDWLYNIENMLKVLDDPMAYVWKATGRELTVPSKPNFDGVFDNVMDRELFAEDELWQKISQLDEIDHGKVDAFVSGLLAAEKYQEPTQKLKIAARGGGVKEVTVTDSQLQDLLNLPEVTSLDDLS